MKIAISGKGGVGKSTIASVLALTLSKQGKNVLALDADPDANLASALGIAQAEQDNILSIAQQITLIEQRTGAKVGTYGQMFTLTPKVDDVADNYAYKTRGVSLLVLGAAHKGGGGCACPESAFLKALVDDLVLDKDDTLIMDMEAGVEHLGRGTAQAVDAMLVIVEPGKRSLDCADLITDMALDLGIENLLYIGSKVRSAQDEEFLMQALGEKLVSCLPFSEEILVADREGICPYDVMNEVWEREIDHIIGLLTV